MSDQLKKKIEMYSENLSDYISKVHEAVEGRYELTGYDLSVIEAALNQLSEQDSKDVTINSTANCPTCGSECSIGGDGETHYYIPKRQSKGVTVSDLRVELFKEIQELRKELSDLREQIYPTLS